MEVKEEFIVTQEWLEKNGARKDELQAFKQHFPNDGKAIEVLTRYMELGYTKYIARIISIIPPFPKSKSAEALELANQLANLKRYFLARLFIEKLPFNETLLVLDNVDGHLFYNGDGYVRGDVNTNMIFITGSLKVEGKLTVKDRGEINARQFSNLEQISASEINLGNLSSIYAQIKAKIVNLFEKSRITGNVDADIVNLNNGSIWGSVNANEIYNDGGFIWENANTNKIENTNGGRVQGRTTIRRALSFDNEQQ